MIHSTGVTYFRLQESHRAIGCKINSWSVGNIN